MIKINASQLSSFEQGLLDIFIKTGVGAVLFILNFASAILTNGSVTIPANFGGAVTLSILTVLVSQLDSYIVDWSAKKEPDTTPLA